MYLLTRSLFESQNFISNSFTLFPILYWEQTLLKIQGILFEGFHKIPNMKLVNITNSTSEICSDFQ
jgi:hypothetical protein